MARWRLTLRQGPTVTKERFATLGEALDALADTLRDAPNPRRAPARALAREITPAAQVATRVEIAGPQRLLASVRGGIDLRGDGSAQAWTGRVNREPVAPRSGEDAVAALRRVLREADGA